MLDDVKAIRVLRMPCTRFKQSRACFTVASEGMCETTAQVRFFFAQRPLGAPQHEHRTWGEEGRPGVTLLIFRTDGPHVDGTDRFTDVDGARSVFTDIGGALSIFTDVYGCGRAIASLAASSRYSTSSS